MAIVIKKWISEKGDVLTPLTLETYNNGNIVSDKGVYYFPVIETTGVPGVGNPMGLLLALTYPA